MDQENRVVVLIDMDCFYCQVEEKLNPELKGKPIAVVQYNPWQGGGIIAVNYIARAQGVTRGMRGNEAKEKCPDIELPSVPCTRGKADISRYREAGKEVARVLQKFTPLLERASIDEAYLDITLPVEERLKHFNLNKVDTNMIPNTYALGYDCIEGFISDIQNQSMENIDFDYEHATRLLIGAVIVSEIRSAVYEETGYRCSGGIAHNKILAKLVCGFNKPNKQTILPKHSINLLYSTLSVKKVKHLGGKFGDSVCEILRISKMAELQKFTEKELQARFDEKNGTWLYNIARGIDLEPVQVRFNPKSIGCCKQFRGKAALLHLESLRKWLKDLGDEIEDRLEQDALENNRTPKQMVVSFATQMPDGKDTSSSRSYNFAADDELCGELFSSKALELVIESSEGVKVKEDESNRRLTAPIKFLGISVGKFEDLAETKKTKKILDYFSAGTSKDIFDRPKNTKHEDKNIDKSKSNFKKNGKEYILQNFFKVSEKPHILQSDHVKPTGAEVGTVQHMETSKSQNIRYITSENVETLKSINVETNVGLLQNQDIESLKTENKFRKVSTVNTQNIASIQSHNIYTNEVTNYEHSVVKTSLDEQESFFAKILNQNVKKNPRINDIDTEEQMRPITPNCDVVKCDDDSNETHYSGSTINEEIDKSMALFEDDPEDISRVISMRQLLNSSKVINEEDQHRVTPEPEQSINRVCQATPQIEPQTVEMVDCTECGKSIPIESVEMHADYHLALRLRDEERQQVRKEKLDKHLEKRKPEESKKKKHATDFSNKNKSISSIASFLIKIDDNVPTETCSECGKRIPIEKFVEHLDFHEAQKLNRELNKKISPQFSGSSAKRKRKSPSPIKKNAKLCTSKSSLFK